jgi:hypothetical protein
VPGDSLPCGPDFVRFASPDLFGLVALPDLDWAHIERWAIEWGVTDRLAALRREATR